MYIPTPFAETDPETLRRFMAANSFATLVSAGGAVPFASHLPLLVDADPAPLGRLQGHMARANPHWQLADGQPVLAVFHGPHAYVSPTWYEAANVVPTWNYVSVHAGGTLRVIDDRPRLLELVRRTVNLYEATQPVPWTLEAQEGEFIDRLLNAIVGFEITLERLEGKWKLNQNHPAERREKVWRALLEREDVEGQEVARLMRDRA